MNKNNYSFTINFIIGIAVMVAYLAAALAVIALVVSSGVLFVKFVGPLGVIAIPFAVLIMCAAYVYAEEKTAHKGD